MLKTLAVVAALAVAVSPALAGPAVTTPAPRQQVQVTAAFLAERTQDMVGQEFEGGITIHAIAAEGDILVFTLNGPAGWRAGFTADTISALLINGFCESAPQFFELGVPLRVDSLDGGQGLLKGPLVDRCPGA